MVNRIKKDVAGAQTALVRARRFAYQTLARRGHSRQEVMEKLQRRGFGVGIVSSVIKELEARNYLDDRVFAMTWAQKAIEHRHLGPLALKTGLHLKGIDREIIEEVLQEIYAGAEEERVALRAVRKRLERMSGGGSEGPRRRLGGYLTRRGFTPEVIEKVLQFMEEN